MVEYEQNDNVEVLLNELIALLSEQEENGWVIALNNLRTKYKESDNKQEVAMMVIRIMQGGSGSLSDLVIQQNGKAIIEENNKLDRLLNDLYEECKKMQ